MPTDIQQIKAFRTVTVNVSPSNEVVVEWSLDPRYKLAGTGMDFYIEMSPDGAAEWIRLNEGAPETNTCVFVDQVTRCGMKNGQFYRVILDDGVEEHASVPQHVLGILNRHDWLLARDIIRKEYLRMVKTHAGNKGWLLKKREHGIKCTTCIDEDLEQVVSSRCPECFGTRYLRGYYDAIPYYMDFNASKRDKQIDVNLGTSDERPEAVRCIAYPRLDSYDIWVDGDTNIRYIVRGVEIISKMRNIPLIYKAALFAINAKAIEYSIPFEQPIGDYIDPPPPETKGGWTSGIASEDVW